MNSFITFARMYTIINILSGEAIVSLVRRRQLPTPKRVGEYILNHDLFQRELKNSLVNN